MADKTLKELLAEVKKIDAANNQQDILDLLVDDVILKQHSNAILWLARGNAHNKLNDFDKAIKDYTEAIRLKPDYSSAYYNRGNSWSSKGDDDKAIKDYTEAIRLKPDYLSAYFNRASSWARKEEHDKAISDYTKAIDLSPNDTDAYNNRGVSWDEKKNYDKAIADYTKAIDLNPNDADVHINMAVTYYHKNDYQNALRCSQKAMEIAPSDEDAKAKVAVYQSLLEEQELHITPEQEQHPIYQLLNTVQKLKREDRVKIFKKSEAILDGVIKEIREYTAQDVDGIETVAHYTRLPIADLFVSDEPKEEKNGIRMRYYNAVYMNDPEEGMILLNCLDEVVQQAFEGANKLEESHVYLGSFLTAQPLCDRLVMWRTYGKDEHAREGAGCSITLGADYFEKTRDIINPLLKPKRDGSGNVTDYTTPQCLYKVQYYDEDTKGKKASRFINDEDGKLDGLITRLNDELKELAQMKQRGVKQKDSEVNKAINRIVFLFISELRYLFKSANYSYESELRVVQLVPPRSERVKIDDANGLPKRLYIEAKNPVQKYIKQIVLGPTVPHPEQWAYLEVAMLKKGFEINVKASECKFQ